MQLRQLRYLIHVAEIGSFSKAGQHLRVAQPALSRQIRLLEDELGVQLLYRDGRGARLTAAGQDLYEGAIKLFKQLSQMREAAVAHKDVLTGEVTVGVPPSVGTVLVPPTIVRAMELFPHLSVKVMESSSIAVLQEWLLSGRIDLAVVNGAAPLSKALTTETFATECLCLIGPVDEGLPQRLTLADVVALPLILPQPTHGLRILLTEACVKAGLELTAGLEVDSVAIMKRLVALGAGYAVLPISVIAGEEGRGLAIRPIADVEIQRDLLFAHATERPLTAAARELQKLLRDVAHATIAEARACLDPARTPSETPAGVASPAAKAVEEAGLP